MTDSDDAYLSEDARDLRDRLPWMAGVPPVVDCGCGWHPLIELLHTWLVGVDPGYVVTQVKEKFGGLRYYVVTSEGADNLVRERVYELVAEIEEESFHICEVCGEPGELDDGPWYRTRCPLHEHRGEQRDALAATSTVGEADPEAGWLEELRETRHAVARRRRAGDEPPLG